MKKKHYNIIEAKAGLWSQAVQTSLALLHALSTISSKIRDFLGKTVPKMMEYRKFQRHQKADITIAPKALCLTSLE